MSPTTANVTTCSQVANLQLVDLAHMAKTVTSSKVELDTCNISFLMEIIHFTVITGLNYT